MSRGQVHCHHIHIFHPASSRHKLFPSFLTFWEFIACYCQLDSNLRPREVIESIFLPVYKVPTFSLVTIPLVNCFGDHLPTPNTMRALDPDVMYAWEHDRTLAHIEFKAARVEVLEITTSGVRPYRGMRRLETGFALANVLFRKSRLL